MYTPSCDYSFTGCIFYLTPVKFKVIPLNVESYLQTQIQKCGQKYVCLSQGTLEQISTATPHNLQLYRKYINVLCQTLAIINHVHANYIV